MIGPLFNGVKKSLYSRMFHDKNKKKTKGYGYQKEIIRNESQIKSFRNINLNTKFRKPLIIKCSECGMTVVGFIKKCPNCGESIS